MQLSFQKYAVKFTKVLLFSILISNAACVAFIVHGFDHDCEGECCPICLNICRAELQLLMFGLAAVFKVSSLKVSERFLLFKKPRFSVFFQLTPIFLKVQLNL
jgi:hypothetical protein